MRTLNSACFHSDMAASVAGITSDANILIDYLRRVAQHHLHTYDEAIPCELLVERVCDLKQGYTQVRSHAVV